MSGGRFADRRILVCGGATGIGAETARLVASEGGGVVVHYRSREDEARTLCEELRGLGGSADALRADLTSPGEVRELVASAGSIHGMVHSVSAPLPGASFKDIDWDDYQSHWETSVKSAYWLVKSALEVERPGLRSVVFVLSTVTFGVPPRNFSSYTTGKYALLGLAKSMAAELAPQGVRVNCVSPGFTETPLTAHVEQRQRDLMARALPMRRLGTVRDAANAIAFLLADGSEYVTGVNLGVAGGSAM